MDKYKCIYVGGDNQEYDEGIWIIKTRTPKTLIVEKISESGVYSNYEKGDKIKCQKKLGKNPFIEFKGGTFTIYPNQSGVPYYFERIERELKV